MASIARTSRRGVGIHLLVFLLIVVLFGVAAPAAEARIKAPPTCPPSSAEAAPGWIAIQAPPFDESPDGSLHQLEGVVVTNEDGGHIFAANRSQLWDSVDGGCHWKKVFAVDNVDIPFVSCDVDEGGCPHLYDLDITDGPDPVIYMQFWYFRQCCESTTSSLVFSSSDLGATWQLLNPTFAPGLSVGRGELEVAPDDSKTLYVQRLSPPGWSGYPSELLVSHDEGATWTAVIPVVESGGVLLEDFSVAKTGELWGIAHYWDQSRGPQLVRSTDGGANWQIVRTPEAPYIGYNIQDLSIGLQSNGEVSVAFVRVSGTGAGNGVFVSRDGGKTWGGLGPGDGGIEVSYLGRVIFAKDSRYVFAIGNTYVQRFDSDTGAFRPVKSHDFSAEFSDNMDHWEPGYVADFGLFALGGCSANQNNECQAIFRYIGLGT